LKDIAREFAFLLDLEQKNK